ncbi:bifunctional proline dehydrogenase/L-glutamate gamma-semialdehyde dehydrogenase [Ruania halotolerans]|uniref:bifunctional proline dehydrogenase/L-glutamate gamma-semialdehyde dehydrogenase n=1 Tax=Ruania halotolerans TaxID=2897773 RepID=UPI001E2D449C|nr:bifunctional proline dehydrogenase/L-glutamate gamma-semialdehyde dehydrogenase [Ruania halotolerans]UFU06370.1 bifunctional proline dehydrogenase/L-glutamate gamma-semialdehyde dehydrogenase [Ruania halotolerans]
MKAESAAVIDEILAQDAIAQVRRWLVASQAHPVDPAARRLAAILRDENGLAFTLGFVDGVIRPEDRRVAARALRDVVPLTPRLLPWHLRAAIRVGGVASRVLPALVVPAARRVLRRMVRHLIVDATDQKLGRSIARLRDREQGIRLNINLLGEAILGDDEASRRVAGTAQLLSRDDVDYVSIKVSSTVAPHSPWSFDDAVEHAVASLSPLFRRAKQDGGKFINLDMEEYKDLDLTEAVFTTLLDAEEFRDLEAGIVLQAYLPDALGVMMRLQEWAARRVARGGAPIKVRVVKGANLPMERVDAESHGWPLATWGSKQESDASYKAVLDYALRPEHIGAVRIGLAGHNLFDIALAWLLAQRRGVTEGVDFEMLLGMATAQAAAVREDVGGLLLYTPVVHPSEFDVAIAYLVRRLEEGASSENFMSAVFDLETEALFDREKQRFLDSIATMPTQVPAPHRRQDRSAPAGTQEQPRLPGFQNTPDTDPAIAANRAWGAAIRARMPHSTLGLATAEDSVIATAADLQDIIDGAVAASEAWRALGADARAEILHRAGDVLQARRADLLEVMGSECGKVLAQGDPEVSEAIDFAHYYAEQGRELEAVDGATFTPARLTVVTPPWNFPVAIPAGSTLAALAAGSAVIIKPAPQARRSGAVMVEALWEAGVPREVLRHVQLSEGELGAQLIGNEAVDRVILTGGYETAERFREIRTDLPLLAETSGKNALIVTPSADYDLAARDVAYSAFGHAGQKCSAASLVILVGSAAESARFRRQLVDAVTSMPVGQPWDEQAQIGPIVGPAEGKLLRALTTLEPGQSWLVEPQQLDDAGTLWRPGIRDGVRPRSEFHLTEYFGPVVGIMTAATLEEAIEYVNRIEYGLTSGLHSLDEAEIAAWMAGVEAGNLYVNRGITGAIVQRQPFGGWKKASVGAGTKAGGPNYLTGFGTWTDAPVAVSGSAVSHDAISRRALRAANALPEVDRDWLGGALSTDEAAWAGEFGIVRDRTGLASEHNAFRYHPDQVTVRFEGDRPVELIRVVAAGARAGAAVTVSAAAALPRQIAEYVAEVAEVHVEDGAAWSARAAHLGRAGGRIRLIGGSAAELAAATHGSPAVALYTDEVVAAGRIELLTYLKEQAVSVTAHRFGTIHRYDIPAVTSQSASFTTN